MSLNRYALTIPPSGVLELAAGNFLQFLTASAAVDIRLETGSSEQFNGIAGGLVLQRVKPWNNARIIGTAGTTVTLFYGAQEDIREDVTDIRLQIASLTGVAVVQDNPASSVSNTAPLAAANAAQSLLFAANPLRRRITIGVDSGNLGSCFARTIGGANNVQELQPGVTYTFAGTYGLDVRNDTGGIATFYRFEEL